MKDVELSQSYKVVLPPEEIVAISDSFVWKPDMIDYRSHPHYVGLRYSSFSIGGFLAYMVFFRAFISVLVKRIIRYETLPKPLRKPNSLNKLVQLIALFIKRFFMSVPEPGESGNSVDAGIFDRDGIIVKTMPDDSYDELLTSVSPYFEQLQARRYSTYSDNRQFEESRLYPEKETAQTLYHVIEDILKASSIFDIARHYLGRPVSLIDVNPQINDETDNFWKKTFPDKDLNDVPKTAYCHRDASGGDLKVIFYLSDVDQEAGPFNYIIGSHHIKPKKLDDYICEANDSNGFSSTNLESRKGIVSLPKKLRQKGTFGNDLMGDEAFSKAIIASMWSITAKKGAFLMFDTKGIHRGGLVRKGVRKVVTCVLG